MLYWIAAILCLWPACGVAARFIGFRDDPHWNEYDWDMAVAWGPIFLGAVLLAAAIDRLGGAI